MKMKMKQFAGAILFALTILISGCSEDGEDGLGFKDADKYGSIKLTLTGNRPDGEAFTSKKVFNIALNPEYSTVYDGTEFVIYRSEGGYEEEGVYLYFDVTDPTQFNFYDFEISTTIVDGTQYFSINQDDYSTEADDSEITNYSYNEETGKLSFKFNFTVDAEENDTGNDLTVSGEVNVTVFEEIGS